MFTITDYFRLFFVFLLSSINIEPEKIHQIFFALPRILNDVFPRKCRFLLRLEKKKNLSHIGI